MDRVGDFTASVGAYPEEYPYYENENAVKSTAAHTQNEGGVRFTEKFAENAECGI